MNNTNRRKAALLSTLVAAALPGLAFAQDPPPSYVANPDIYKVIAQDDRYVVMEVTWKPGQKDKMHSHPKGLAVHFLTDCHSRTTTAEGKVSENKRKAGTTVISPPVKAHTFENLGTADCKHIHVEAK